jgi:hypothetical protein
MTASKCDSIPAMGEFVPLCFTLIFLPGSILLNIFLILISLVSKLYFLHILITSSNAPQGTQHFFPVVCLWILSEASAFSEANSIAHSSRASWTRSLRACFEAFIFLFGRPPLFQVSCESSPLVVVVRMASLSVTTVSATGLRNRAELAGDESVISDTIVCW